MYFQNQVCGEGDSEDEVEGKGKKTSPTHTNSSNTAKCLTTCKSLKTTNPLVSIRWPDLLIGFLPVPV